MQAGTPHSGRRRTAGTRDRVLGCLLAHGDIRDASGMASSRLARAAGYAGSSVAFAQLLSAMERAGLIIRQVRGRRTYHVGLTAAGRERAHLIAGAGPPPVVPGGNVAPASGAPREGAGATTAQDRGQGARRAGAAGDGGPPDYDELAHRLLVQVVRCLDAGRGCAEGQQVAALERELAAARAAMDSLRAENEDLRGRLLRIRGILDPGPCP